MSDDFMEMPPPQEEGAPAWMATFGDLMSLLMCFFVLLLSFSEMDRQKYKEISGSLKNAFGIQYKKQIWESPKGTKIIAKDFDERPITFTHTVDELFIEVKKEINASFREMKDLIEMKEEEKKVTIRLMGESTFDSGVSEIRQEMLPLLSKIGVALSQTSEYIIIAGHTDNVPIGSGNRFRTNWELSTARAISVSTYFIENGWVPPDRIAAMGFGEYRPIASNDRANGRQKNRRVEIILGNLAEVLNDP